MCLQKFTQRECSLAIRKFLSIVFLLKGFPTNFYQVGISTEGDQK